MNATYNPRTATYSRTDGDVIELYTPAARLMRYDAARGVCMVRTLGPGNVVDLRALPYDVARDMPGLLDR